MTKISVLFQNQMRKIENLKVYKTSEIKNDPDPSRVVLDMRFTDRAIINDPDDYEETYIDMSEPEEPEVPEVPEQPATPMSKEDIISKFCNTAIKKVIAEKIVPNLPVPSTQMNYIKNKMSSSIYKSLIREKDNFSLEEYDMLNTAMHLNSALLKNTEWLSISAVKIQQANVEEENLEFIIKILVDCFIDPNIIVDDNEEDEGDDDQSVQITRCLDVSEPISVEAYYNDNEGTVYHFTSGDLDIAKVVDKEDQIVSRTVYDENNNPIDIANEKVSLYSHMRKIIPHMIIEIPGDQDFDDFMFSDISIKILGGLTPSVAAVKLRENDNKKLIGIYIVDDSYSDVFISGDYEYSAAFNQVIESKLPDIDDDVLSKLPVMTHNGFASELYHIGIEEDDYKLIMDKLQLNTTFRYPTPRRSKSQNDKIPVHYRNR